MRPPSVNTSASVETQTFDDANQITTHTYDDRGRPTSDGTRTFTWDSADRLIGVVNGGSTLAYDYTATGQITSRTLNGQTTDYCYAYSVASQPILAERKSAAFTRFYVALPDGRLLYQIDLTPTPAVRFYHFGKVGETRFLTDAAGAVTDAYAYDGHGRLLGKTGASDQIYAFTGQLGVRHDPEANLVHMRARHYAPVSGRFLSRDPIHLALMGRNGQHANPYHFVEGRVTSVVDPSGLDAFFNDMWEFSEDNLGPLPANHAPADNGPMFVFGSTGGEEDGSDGNGVFEIAIQAQRAIDRLKGLGQEITDEVRALVLQGTIDGLSATREKRQFEEDFGKKIEEGQAIRKAVFAGYDEVDEAADERDGDAARKKEEFRREVERLKNASRFGEEATAHGGSHDRFK